jgi:hypothetical protein
VPGNLPEDIDMAKINQDAAPAGSGSRYPAPFDVPCRGRSWRGLGEVAGLTQFGVSGVNYFDRPATTILAGSVGMISVSFT